MGMFLLQFLVDCAALVVRRMVAATEDTADITRAIFSVTLGSEMVTGAFDASRFEMTVVLCVSVSLAFNALSNVSFVLRRYKFYFTLLKVFDKEDVLVGRGRLQVHKKHGKGELGAILLNVPNVGDHVAEGRGSQFLL
jgi:hypothetical protein